MEKLKRKGMLVPILPDPVIPCTNYTDTGISLDKLMFEGWLGYSLLRGGELTYNEVSTRTMNLYIRMANKQFVL